MNSDNCQAEAVFPGYSFRLESHLSNTAHPNKTKEEKIPGTVLSLSPCERSEKASLLKLLKKISPTLIK